MDSKIRQEKIKELTEDVGFLSKIINMETKEEIVDCFATKGIKVTDEDLEAIKQTVSKSLKQGKPEKITTGDELEKVVGGRGRKDQPMMAEPGSPMTPDSNNKSQESGSMPAVGLMVLGGAVGAIGVALSGVAIATRIKKGSWLSNV